MRYTWLGHASVRLEIGDQVFLIDPWTQGPTFPADHLGALDGVTAILITHGHFDHVAGAPELAVARDLPVYGIVDLMGFWESVHKINAIGFNKGGTVAIGDVKVTAVGAAHSSALVHNDRVIPVGEPLGFMIEGEGRTVYVSGDTDVMADMAIWQELHTPEIGILCAGGHFTMDMKRAAYAASKLFKFKTVIPYHYQTFPLLEQNADAMRAALPGVTVHAPGVMEPIDL